MLQKFGVEFDFFYLKGKGIAGYFLNGYRLWHYLRKHKYAVVHAHNGLSGFIAVMQPFCKTIITFHGSDINQKKTRLISNFACLMANYRIFVSSYLYEKLYIKPAKNYSVVPCGINLDTFFPMDKNDAHRRLNMNENQTYVLFPSYFSNPAKNYSLAKMAMSLVPEAQLLELKNKSREDVNLLLNAVDVLLVTSPAEGSPQVIKEAMACNCPIVTTNVGDVNWVLGNIDGCFISSYEPEDVAEKIKLAIQFRKKYGQTIGRERITELGLDSVTVAEKIFEVYNKVLKI
jgi:glycosyltransferase involved in cell wall biosynthesis